MADLSWINLLQRPVDPQQAQLNALRAQAMRMEMQKQQQEQQGYNALAKLYQNPANLNNGVPTTNALSQAIGSGQVPPQVAIPLMGEQAKIVHNQTVAREDQQKLLHNELVGVIDEVSVPAKAEYDKVLKDTGSAQTAQQAADKVYSERLQMKMQTVSPETRRAMEANPHYDDTRVTSAIMGATGLREKLKQQEEGAGWQVRKETTAGGQTIEYRYNPRTGEATTLQGQPYTPIGVAAGTGAEAKPEYQGTITKDGKVENNVPLLYGPQGFMDARTRTLVPKDQVSGVRKMGSQEQFGADIPAPGQPSLSGEEYLKSLPTSQQIQVKGLAEGRMQFPSGFALRSPYWQQMLQAVAQYDPSFDAVNYNARATTRKDFTSGKSAQNITSFNTAIGHLGTLDKAAEGLENRWNPMWNTLANAVESAAGDPRIVKFNTAKQAVADELTRAFRGTGGNVADIRGWEENLSSSNSPAQLKAAVKQAVDLLRSRIESVGEQYRRGMGTTADVMDLLTPAAKKTLAQLPGGEDLATDKGAKAGAVGATGQEGTIEPPGGPPASQAPQGAAQGPQATPVTGPPPNIVSQMKNGDAVNSPDGQHRWVKRDGKLVQVY